MVVYEAYLSSEFDATIINNEENKTFIPAAEGNTGRFEESASGEPLYTTKIAICNSKVGELGHSYIGGAYNTSEDDGLHTGLEKCNAQCSLPLEYVDWNVGKFTETGDNIGDRTWSIVPALSFRPNSQTVFRINYRHQRTTNLFENPPAMLGE